LLKSYNQEIEINEQEKREIEENCSKVSFDVIDKKDSHI